jgi:hypothetical protein
MPGTEELVGDYTRSLASGNILYHKWHPLRFNEEEETTCSKGEQMEGGGIYNLVYTWQYPKKYKINYELKWLSSSSMSICL